MDLGPAHGVIAFGSGHVSKSFCKPLNGIAAEFDLGDPFGMLRLRKDVAGNAGVLFVAAELSRRGLNALPTIRNTEGVDIIASEPLGGRSVGIQVKTNQSGQKKWLLSKKSEELESPTLFYVLVNLGALGELPKFHVVPSKTVADAVRESHAAWRRKPRRDGSEHGDSSLRVFYDVEGKFLDKWDLLGLTLIA